jgi:DNA-binding transcriptional LysR family regulator
MLVLPLVRNNPTDRYWVSNIKWLSFHTCGVSMELRHLRYFSVLGSTLNFTRAAEQLHIAQPPLSRQIQQLEDELGVELLDRSSRPLALTRAGAFFYEQSLQILARLQEISLATKRLGDGKRRWIGVGFVPTLLYGALPKVIQKFMAAHPELDVVLTELTSIQQVEALRAGRIDVGLGRVPIEADGLLNTVIEEEPLVAVLPASSELAKLKRVSLEVLSSQTIILYPAQPRPSFADQVLSHFRNRGFPIRSTYETNGLQTALGMVAAGIGFSLVPRSVQQFRREDIVYRPISDTGIFSPVLMTTRLDDQSKDLVSLCAEIRSAMGTGAVGATRRAHGCSVAP